MSGGCIVSIHAPPTSRHWRVRAVIGGTFSVIRRHSDGRSGSQPRTPQPALEGRRVRRQWYYFDDTPDFDRVMTLDPASIGEAESTHTVSWVREWTGRLYTRSAPKKSIPSVLSANRRGSIVLAARR